MTNNIVLPSGVGVTIKQLSGRAEKVLTDRSFIKNGSAVDRFLMECIESIDGQENLTPQEKERLLLDMYSGDRNYLLMQIRIASYGSTMIFNARCPDCKKTSGYEADLEALIDSGEMKIHDYMPEPHVVSLSGGVAEINHMRGRDERAMAKMDTGDMLALTMMRVASLNGAHPTMKQMLDMRARDLLAIRDGITDMKGGLEAVLELDCDRCGNTYTMQVYDISDFFIPTRTSMEKSGA